MDDKMRFSRPCQTILDTIGQTPLIRLHRVVEGVPGEVYVKVEGFNPGQSAKDRIALYMIEQAEKRGELKPGATLIEATSGNTGFSLAMVAAIKGYKCVLTAASKISKEKVDMLEALGAEVVICPKSAYYKMAERLAQEIPNAYYVNQNFNLENAEAHYLTTGPEIWEQTGGRVTVLVASAGTGGTLSGTARYLKEQNPDIKIIAADPEGSVFSGGSGRPYLVEGVGEDFFPAAWQPELYDETIAISDAESFHTARRVSQLEGILIGGSGGMAVAAAIQVAKRAGPDDIVVVFNPDSGRGYLSRVFDDEWMANFGFTTECEQCVGAVLDAKNPSLDSLLYVNPDETVRTAIERMREYGVSQLPVCKNTPPFAAAEVSGSVDELELMEAIAGDSAVMDVAVEDVMGPHLPTIGAGQRLERALEMLHTAPALLVLSDGRPLSVLTRTDILSYFDSRADY